MSVPEAVAKVVMADRSRVTCLTVVRDRLGPAFYIAAGFVRNPCWDAWYGNGQDWPSADIDVLYHNPDDLDPETDLAFETQLRETEPAFDWEVRNQARMHLRNHDPKYDSISMSMRHWLEVVTGVAVRLTPNGQLDGMTSFGWQDLLQGIYRPTEAGRRKPDQLFERYLNKRMAERWPGVDFRLGEDIFQGQLKEAAS